MLNVGNVKVPVCHGFTRRSFLRAGTAGLAGLALPDLFRLQAAGAETRPARIRNCITIFLVGSPGHLDTWDMKPDAPAEVRGKFKPIDTNVPGLRICEHFPLMARHMDQILPNAEPVLVDLRRGRVHRIDAATKPADIESWLAGEAAGFTAMWSATAAA